nr:phosphoglycolate phosphatase [Pseudomonadota bacterium]
MTAAPRPPACSLFDLDGTLLDTAPDMARALNRLRLEQGLALLDFAAIRPVVSHGAAGLIRLGFGLTADDPRFESLRRRFLALYNEALAVDTVLFPGMEGI